jgi:hypothetical protein
MLYQRTRDNPIIAGGPQQNKKLKFFRRIKMKKIIFTAFAVALLTLTVPSLADISVDLIADGGDTRFDAGDVEVTSDGTTLTIRITVNQAVDPWELVESHVHVAETAGQVPQKNGNPRPGKFDFHDDDPEATTVTATVHEYTIPYSLAESESVVVAVHAAIEWLEVTPDPDGTGPEPDPPDILHEETGWAEGTDFPGKNWAMYIEGELACEWDLTGVWELRFVYGSNYDHDMTVTVHDVWGDGSFVGTGGYPAGGSYSITWTVDGSVSDDAVEFTITYDPPSTYEVDAVGTIAGDGTMGGTWSSNIGQSGNWMSISGAAMQTCTLQLLP